MTQATMVAADLPRFDRHFWDGTFRFTRMGKGGLGGKAGGLQGVGAPVGAIGAIAPEQGLDAFIPPAREEDLGKEMG